MMIIDGLIIVWGLRRHNTYTFLLLLDVFSNQGITPFGGWEPLFGKQRACAVGPVCADLFKRPCAGSRR